ncbi:LOW QUALITY PROTEIN: hypothetical protein CapIbe_023211 [Capra ibex]
MKPAAPEDLKGTGRAVLGHLPGVVNGTEVLGHGLWEREDWCNQSIVPWCTADAQFELVDWQTGAGQAISLSGLPFFLVAAFKIRQEQAPSACDLLWGQSPASLQQTAGPKEGHWRDQDREPQDGRDSLGSEEQPGVSGCWPQSSLPLRLGVICSSNQNQSVEVHNILSNRGFSVRSFGTGPNVKLPGRARDRPNVYDFRTTYDKMNQDLLRKDKELYMQNGVLQMLERNDIKPRPERFQDCKDPFDLILTCEKQVYDQVVEDMSTREQGTCQPVHVINVNNLETHKEATLGAFLICDLCQCVQLMEGMEDRIGELLQVFEEKSGRSFLHTVCFY